MSSAHSSKLPGLKGPSKVPKPGGRGLGSASSSRAPSPEPQVAAPAAGSSEAIDDFILGDRVYVSGSKPGIVAFLGETQFAAGQWAGVVLDDLSGKNDGSVQGIRYFQCEPNRGIFSRPSKLTRQPGSAGGPSSTSHIAARNTAAQLPSAVAVGSALTDSAIAAPSPTSPLVPLPTPLSAGVAKEKTLQKNNSAITSSALSLSGEASATSAATGAAAASAQPTAATTQHLKIGDRVLVNGARLGVLRYLGTTDFASGEWAGVELDDPQGKNDGSVAGKRYFTCTPMHGLFAPAHKVAKEREAASDMAASPAIVPGPRFTTPLKPGAATQQSSDTGAAAARRAPSVSANAAASAKLRSASRESLTSVGSAASSSVSRSRATAFKSTVTGPASRRISTSATPSVPSSNTGTTSALQKALKEKDEHIEQLLRERDLERSDVARAAAQVDDVESQLACVRVEYEHLQCEMRNNMQLLNEKITELEMERNTALLQADELRRRIEDLQFQIEEDAISKNDLEEAKGEEDQMLHALQLEVEREKASRQLIMDELQSVKGQLLDARQKVISSEQSAISYLEQIEALSSKLNAQEKRLADGANTNEIVIQQQEQRIKELLRDIDRLQAERLADAKSNSQTTSHMAAELHQKDTVISTLEDTIADLKKQFAVMQLHESSLDEKLRELQHELESRARETDSLCNKVQRGKSDMQDVTRQLAASEAKCASLIDDKSKLELAMSEIVRNSGDSSMQLSLLNDQLREKDRQITEFQDQLRAGEQLVARMQYEASIAGEQHARDKDAVSLQYNNKLKEAHERLDQLQTELEMCGRNAKEAGEKHSSVMAAAEVTWQQRLGDTKKEHSLQLAAAEVRRIDAVTAACKPLEEQCLALVHRAELEEQQRVSAEQRMEDQRSRLNADLDELRRSLAAAEKGSDERSTLIDSLQRDLCSLRTQLERQSAAGEAAVSEVREQLNRERDELLNQLNAERAAAAEQLRSAVSSAQAERSTFAETRERLDFEVAELRSLLEAERAMAAERLLEHQASAELLRSAVSEAQERLEFEAVEARSHLETECAALRARLDEERAGFDKEIRHAREACDELEFEAVETRNLFDSELLTLKAAFEEERARLMSEVHLAHEVRDKIEFEMTEARSQLESEHAAVKQQLRAAEQLAASVKQQLRAAEQLAASAGDRGESSAARAQLEAECASLRKRLEEESLRATDQQAAAAELRERLEFELVEQRSQLEAGRTELKLRAEKEKARLESELSAAIEAREKYEFEATEARSHLEAACTSLRDRLEEERAQFERNLRVAVDAREKLEFEATEARSQVESECAALRQRLDKTKTRLSAELSAAAEAREKLEFEIIEARSQLEAELARGAQALAPGEAYEQAAAKLQEQHVHEMTVLNGKYDAARAELEATRNELQAAQDELEASRAACTEQHDRRCAEVGDMQAQLEGARIAANDLRVQSGFEIAELRNQLETARAAAVDQKEQHEFDLAEMRSQLEAARLASSDLLGQLEASRAAAAELREEHDFEITELRSQLEAARAADTALSAAAARERSLLAEVERIKEEAIALQSLLRKLEAEKADIANDLETVTFEKEEYELKYTDKCKEATGFADGLTACRLDLERLEAVNSKLHGEVQQTSSKIEMLTQEKSNLTKDKMRADAVVKEKSIQIEDMQERLEKAEAEVRMHALNADGQLEAVRRSSAKELDTLNQELVSSTTTLEVVQEQLRGALEDQRRLAEQLAMSRSTNEDRVTQLEIESRQLSLEKEELLIRIKATEQLHSAERTRLASEADAARRRAHSLESEVRGLHDENHLLNSSKASVDSLMNDKRRLEAEVAELKLRIPSAAAHAAGDSVNHDDKIDLECQINFLNSVIVDLQQKNEELKRQMEVLALGQGDEENGRVDASASYYGTPVAPGARPPRLFCDICDVFDAHDTDDCPLQASSSSPPPSHHGGSRNAPDRPYCDICEVFGHWTEDCNDEETY